MEFVFAEGIMRARTREKRWYVRRTLAFAGYVAAAMALVLLFAGAGAAQAPKVAPAKAAAETPVAAPALVARALTAADLEAFLDGLVPLQIQQRDIAGAVVVVIHNGQVLFSKGYGYADAAKRTPVLPATTLFRPGSVSKLFTWTAVMQLVEQKKLDLDRDVNEYLDFQIPPAFDKPITLRHIMTHTAGFEDILRNLFANDAAKMPSLQSYVSLQVPRRVYAPGSTVSYSNYATALAGYIVERVSGRPFPDYVAENIFKPLGMEHSTFAQPLPEPLRAHAASGYVLASSPARPFELVPASPAGALSSSGLDMARFITAHLQEGRHAGGSILRPETVKLMHTQQYATHPALNGMALGFYEETRNGHRIIGHGGDTVLFHSDLHLVPDAGLGFFISYNSAGRGEGSLRGAVWQGLLDRYFPHTPDAAAKINSGAEDIRAVSGSYIVSRRNQSAFLRVLAMLGSVTISGNANGFLEINILKDLNGQTRRWEAVAPLTFREVHGQELLVFRPNTSGRLEAGLSALPIMVFQRASWHEGRLLLWFFGFALAVFALTLVFWGVGALLRRHYNSRLVLTPRERRVRIAARVACGFILLFVVGFLMLFQRVQNDIGMFNSSLDPWLRLLQAIGWIGAAGALFILYDAYLVWSSATRGRVAKFASTLLVLAFVAWTWFAAVSNALSLSLAY